MLNLLQAANKHHMTQLLRCSVFIQCHNFAK